jgi:hypothetical protein
MMYIRSQPPRLSKASGRLLNTECQARESENGETGLPSGSVIEDTGYYVRIQEILLAHPICQLLNSRNWQILAPLGEFTGKKPTKIKTFPDIFVKTN